MQPQDFDQPPASTGNGLQPPAAPQSLQPAQPFQPPTPAGPPPQGPATNPTPNPYNGDDDDNDSGSRKRRLLIIAGSILGLVLIGSVIALALAGDSDKSGSKTTNPASQNSDKAVITSTNPQFFYTQVESAKQNPVLHFVDAVTGKQAKQTLMLNDSFQTGSPYRTLAPHEAGMNQPIQITSEGKVIAYATVTQQGTGGEGGGLASSIPGSFTISGGNRTGAHQPILAGKDAQAILDWKLSADGKQVYYLEAPATPNKEAYAKVGLHSVNVNTGQNKKLGDVPYDSSRDHSHLAEVVKDNIVRYYSSLTNGMYQTTYDLETEKVAHDLIVGNSQYAFGSFGNLSPNGEHLMYIGNPQGQKIVVYRIGVDTGEVQTIFDPADNRTAYMATAWSADSKKILVTTYPYNSGQQQPDFKYQLISYDVTTNKQVKLAETVAPGIVTQGEAGTYGLAQWAGNQRYITYVQGQKVHFYDVSKAKTLTTPQVSLKSALLSDSATGWIQIPTEE